MSDNILCSDLFPCDDFGGYDGNELSINFDDESEESGESSDGQYILDCLSPSCQTCILQQLFESLERFKCDSRSRNWIFLFDGCSSIDDFREYVETELYKNLTDTDKDHFDCYYGLCENKLALYLRVSPTKDGKSKFQKLKERFDCSNCFAVCSNTTDFTSTIRSIFDSFCSSCIRYHPKKPQIKNEAKRVRVSSQRCGKLKQAIDTGINRVNVEEEGEADSLESSDTISGCIVKSERIASDISCSWSRAVGDSIPFQDCITSNTNHELHINVCFSVGTFEYQIPLMVHVQEHISSVRHRIMTILKCQNITDIEQYACVLHSSSAVLGSSIELVDVFEDIETSSCIGHYFRSSGSLLVTLVCLPKTSVDKDKDKQSALPGTSSEDSSDDEVFYPATLTNRSQLYSQGSTASQRVTNTNQLLLNHPITYSNANQGKHDKEVAEVAAEEGNSMSYNIDSDLLELLESMPMSCFTNTEDMEVTNMELLDCLGPKDLEEHSHVRSATDSDGSSYDANADKYDSIFFASPPCRISNRPSIMLNQSECVPGVSLQCTNFNDNSKFEDRTASTSVPCSTNINCDVPQARTNMSANMLRKLWTLMFQFSNISQDNRNSIMNAFLTRLMDAKKISGRQIVPSPCIASRKRRMCQLVASEEVSPVCVTTSHAFSELDLNVWMEALVDLFDAFTLQGLSPESSSILSAPSMSRVSSRNAFRKISVDQSVASLLNLECYPVIPSAATGSPIPLLPTTTVNEANGMGWGMVLPCLNSYLCDKDRQSQVDDIIYLLTVKNPDTHTSTISDNDVNNAKKKKVDYARKDMFI